MRWVHEVVVKFELEPLTAITIANIKSKITPVGQDNCKRKRKWKCKAEYCQHTTNRQDVGVEEL